MPPVRASADVGSRRTKPFKPPTRISSGESSSIGARTSSSKAPVASKAKLPVNKTARQNKTNRTTVISSDDEDEDDEDDEMQHEASKNSKSGNSRRTTLQSRAVEPSTPRRQSTTALAVVDADPLSILQDDPNENTIPRPLLARLLYQGFEDKNMKIGKEAMGVLDVYIKVFVKEAIARSRQETIDKAEANGELDSSWVQVEDLETIAPQLMLDF